MSRETHRKDIAKQQQRRRQEDREVVGTCGCGLVVTRLMLANQDALHFGFGKVLCTKCEGGPC